MLFNLIILKNLLVNRLILKITLKRVLKFKKYNAYFLSNIYNVYSLLNV